MTCTTLEDYDEQAVVDAFLEIELLCLNQDDTPAGNLEAISAVVARTLIGVRQVNTAAPTPLSLEERVTLSLDGLPRVATEDAFYFAHDPVGAFPAKVRVRRLKWKAQDPDDTDERWIADAFMFIYHIHSEWIDRQSGSLFRVWVTPWDTVPDLNRWETAGHLSLGEFDAFDKAAAAAQTHLLTLPASRQRLARLVHDLRHSAVLIREGHKTLSEAFDSIKTWGAELGLERVQ